MKCYTYKLTLVPDTRYYYYGVRNIYRGTLPEYDGYFGSGTKIRQLRKIYGKDCFTKEVLTLFQERESCLREEQRLVGNLWKTDPFCLNRMPGGAYKRFDLTGLKVIHLGPDLRYVAPENLDKFLEEGWQVGPPETTAGRRRGTRIVTDGVFEKMVDVKDLPEWEQKGWVPGRCRRVVERLQSRVLVSSGSFNKAVQPEEVERYRSLGWTPGRSREAVERGAEWHRGTRILHLGTENKAVRPEELEDYLSAGYVPGLYRKPVEMSEERRKKIQDTQKGRIWVRNSEKGCRKILPEELQKYLSEGWEPGRQPGQKGTTTGRVKIFNPGTGERKAVTREDLKDWIGKGWVKGRGW